MDLKSNKDIYKILREDGYLDKEIKIIINIMKQPQQHKFSLKYKNHIDSLPYKQRLNQFKIPIHNGQRKLFLCSLLFLVKYSHLSKLLVYAGGAPGTNIIILAKLYPNLKFHLYDPRPFDDRLENLKNVQLFQCYFTNDIARSYKKKNVMLWSDIRTGTVDDDDFEEQIMENNNMQKEWHDLAKPIMGMYKFRLPYSTNFQSTKFNQSDDSFAKNINYMKGTIWLQMWAPTTSTETRLVVKQNYKMVEYDCLEYESRLYYWNLIDRQWKTFKEYSGIQIMSEYCNCFDCTGEKYILDKYLQSIHKDTPANIESLSKCISSYLNSIQHLHHGYIDKPLWDKYIITMNLFKEKVLRERDKKIQIRKKCYDMNATKLIKT